MSAVLNALLRCVAFLLPPSWFGFCWWVGEASWPNPRARLKRTKPLTYEEVAAEHEPAHRSRTFWSAAARVLTAPFALHTRSGSSFPAVGGPESSGTAEAITAEQHAHLRDMSAPVTITVAIQAAEDEEPDEEPSTNTIELHTGSGSDDDIELHDKSRYSFTYQLQNHTHTH